MRIMKQGRLGKRHLRTDGFSLMEMLVSIAIIVLLMSAVFPFLFQAQKRFQGNVVVSEANQAARAGLEVMAQEIGQVQARLDVEAGESGLDPDSEQRDGPGIVACDIFSEHSSLRPMFFASPMNSFQHFRWSELLTQRAREHTPDCSARCCSA